MTSAADTLAGWATSLVPSADDLALARRSLLDTLAVTWAARDDPLRHVFAALSEPGRWAAFAHVLDYDDLHMPSTAHISAVCIPAALASGGDERAYLAGAGVMARLGQALGWRHYRSGWHATCTAGAPAAAATAAIARGFDAERTAVALALAVPAAGGMQRAFGTAAKALQVGFAAEAGVRAAALAQAGATADPRALDDWLVLVGAGDRGLAAAARPDDPAVPGGLAIKLFPCCYALQRPIAAALTLPRADPERIRGIRVRTPHSALIPLIHHRPRTGLEAKFSLEYAIATSLLDGRPRLDAFGDKAVRREAVQRLLARVEVDADADGEGLLAGEVAIEVVLDGGERSRAALAVPPGAPGHPPTADELRDKLEICAGSDAGMLVATGYTGASELLRACHR